MSVNAYRGINYDAVWNGSNVRVTIKTQSIIEEITVNPLFDLFDPICLKLCIDHNVYLTYPLYADLVDALLSRKKWMYNGLTIDVTDDRDNDQITVDICRGELIDRFVFTHEQWGKMLVPLQFASFINQPRVEGTEVKEKHNNDE